MVAEFYQLEMFVRDALRANKKKDEIADALAAAGWPQAQIKSALNAFWDGDFVVPVPRPRPSLNARDAFLYLVMFSSLYYGAWNLGDLLFSFIDRAFPDPSFKTYYSPWDSERWSTAAIIIAFPVFFAIARYVSGQVRQNPSKRLSPPRRWLTYLTLFASTLTLLGDVTTLIYNLLGGELTIRFLLKVLVVAAIAGTIFTYYLLDLRKEEQE